MWSDSVANIERLCVSQLRECGEEGEGRGHLRARTHVVSYKIHVAIPARILKITEIRLSLTSYIKTWDKTWKIKIKKIERNRKSPYPNALIAGEIHNHVSFVSDVYWDAAPSLPWHPQAIILEDVRDYESFWNWEFRRKSIHSGGMDGDRLNKWICVQKWAKHLLNPETVSAALRSLFQHVKPIILIFTLRNIIHRNFCVWS